jgi:hypothetical protein
VRTHRAGKSRRCARVGERLPMCAAGCGHRGEVGEGVAAVLLQRGLRHVRTHRVRHASRRALLHRALARRHVGGERRQQGAPGQVRVAVRVRLWRAAAAT